MKPAKIIRRFLMPSFVVSGLCWLRYSAMVSPRPGIEHFSLKGGRKGVFEIDAEGRFHDILGVHDLDAHVDLEARDLAVLGALFRKKLPPIGIDYCSVSVARAPRRTS